MGLRMIREFDVASLRTKLEHCRFGTDIVYLQETDSTQNLALQRVREGVGEGLLVLAETQTAGRGRMGRQWHSPPGSGVYMSLIMQPRVPHRYMPQLTVVAAVALCRSLRRMTQADIRMKWPNDLYVGNRKISGILIEAGQSSSALESSAVVMGVGISVNLRAEDIPQSLQEKATSLLAVTGQAWERESIVAHFLWELAEMMELYKTAGFGIFRTLWEANAWRPEQPIEMNTRTGTVRGYPESIDENGALLVRLEDGQLQVVQPSEYGV